MRKGREEDKKKRREVVKKRRRSLLMKTCLFGTLGSSLIRIVWT